MKTTIGVFIQCKGEPFQRLNVATIADAQAAVARYAALYQDEGKDLSSDFGPCCAYIWDRGYCVQVADLSPSSFELCCEYPPAYSGLRLTMAEIANRVGVEVTS
jgi:hypothetical protein